MGITNKQIRARARYLLDDNIFGKDWIKSVLLSIIAAVLTSVAASILSFLTEWITPLLSVLLSAIGVTSPIFFTIANLLMVVIDFLAANILVGPIAVGLSSVHLNLERGDGKIRIGKLFDGFKNFFGNFQLGLMYTLHIFLWSLLFIVPGIYVSYSYAMIYHVKHDNPEFTWKECFDESERLMEGNRWRLFKLQISFIGWVFLGAIAFFGIGSLWVTPYMNVSTAVFYDVIKEEKELEELEY